MADSTPVTDSDRGRDRFEERYGGGATEPGVPEALRPGELVRLLALMHLNHSPTMVSQMNFAQQGQRCVAVISSALTGVFEVPGS